ncbi:MAG TPA: glucosamine-6-phosphate deaminase, partial [Candidatus Ruania gallistercoris]|nr:glucosamine-6-phosphate deaminase [Candidatus Ruania gallistercoris]
MELIIQPDDRAIATLVADAVTSLLERKPDAVLGLATGSSPLAVYDELVRRHEAGQVSFARSRAFLL